MTAALVWPIERLGEGLHELASRSGFVSGPAPHPETPAGLRHGSAAELDHWLTWIESSIGVDLQPVETPVPQVGNVLLHAGPAVLRVEGNGGFLFILGSRFGHVRVLSPSLRVRHVPAGELRDLVCAAAEAPVIPAINQILDATGIAASRRRQTGRALMRERLADRRIGGIWLMRLPPSARFGRQFVRERGPGRLALLAACFATLYCLELAGWSVIGDAALNGRVDFGWLYAWILIVFSAIPVRLAGQWLDATLAIDVAGLLKLRLLLGSLQSDIEKIKTQGVGRLLGRVIESEALEALAVNGGLAGMVALLELCFAAWVLWMGAAGSIHLVLLTIWVAVTALLGWRYFRKLSRWTDVRLDMTHDLIEQMVGHRTRLAQEIPSRRATVEDDLAKTYLSASADLDRSILPFLAGIPAGWMIIGLLGLGPAFVSGSATPVGLAISLGGLLIAHRALSGIANGLNAASRAAIAWREAAPLFVAGAESAPRTPYFPLDHAGTRPRPPLIDAEGITYRYKQSEEPVIDKANVAIAHGDRILLEGASGGGKSTLASLLVGLRTAGSGLLLLNGLDRQTLGPDWHRIATEAPQFHENHVFTGSLAFNLLMGRRWPASPDDIAEAEALCRDLDLGPLIDRMPSGLMQTVGESGWQLSHGERSRVFLARALLQRADLTILDESFAALDPQTLRTCLQCTFARARTLVVIAHP